MTLKKQLAASTGLPMDSIPGSWQFLGDIALAKFPKIKTREKRTIANALLVLFPRIRLVGELKRIAGELRQPRVRLLAARKGENKSFETTHREHGIVFKLDASKIMFSKGNLTERARLIKAIRPNETICDMFAGIGYFSLGLGKYTKAKRIYAIEKNSVAFRYLKQNIRLNKIKNIVTIRGDCRRIRRDIAADRVLLGYFPNTERYLSAAFRFLKHHGVLHYHNIYKRSELWTKPLNEVQRAAKHAGYKILSVAQRVVKSYAPGILHIVLDIEVEKLR